MGYFPNGTDGEIWTEDNCRHCVHSTEEGDCPVLLAHELYNYDQIGKHDLEMVLGILIPRKAGGVGNKECAMRYEETW